MLRTGCILMPPTSVDGMRISVMSRHTLSDGVTPDNRITHDLYDLWCKELAPQDKFVGRYYRGEITFAQYRDLYHAYLRSATRAMLLCEIAQCALYETITFLCIEATPEWCHRTLLLLECVRYAPQLRIENY